MEFNKLSNAELRIKLKEIEGEFEVVKCELNDKISKLNDLDTKYTKIKKIIDSRNKNML